LSKIESAPESGFFYALLKHKKKKKQPSVRGNLSGLFYAAFSFPRCNPKMIMS
jgi:hypothetical protein